MIPHFFEDIGEANLNIYPVISKAPTFTNILWECLTAHQISQSNQFAMLSADHIYFQEKLSKWAVYGQLYNMGHIMRKCVNQKSSYQPAPPYSMTIPWKFYYGKFQLI